MIQTETTPNPNSLKFLSEKTISLIGTEEFQIKRGGAYTFILECRRNNEFKNQAVAVSINKTVSNNWALSYSKEY